MALGQDFVLATAMAFLGGHEADRAVSMFAVVPADSSPAEKWGEGTARHPLPRIVTEVSAGQCVLRQISQPAVDPHVLS
jgi:hypothetical protein